MTKFLTLCALTLIVIHSMILILYFWIGDPNTFDFVRLFDLDMERNIPTVFSSSLLLIASFLFYLRSKVAGEKQTGLQGYWIGLCVVFAFLGFDEGAKIHEQVGDLTSEYFSIVNQYEIFPWVFAYGISLFGLTAVYIRFFLCISRSLFKRLMIAAAIYLSGAIGFDMLGGYLSAHYGIASVPYSLAYTVEESLEMFGVIYLIDLLLAELDLSKILIHSS